MCMCVVCVCVCGCVCVCVCVCVCDMKKVQTPELVDLSEFGALRSVQTTIGLFQFVKHEKMQH